MAPGNVAEVHLVGVRHVEETLRSQMNGLRQPAEIVSQRNQALISKCRDESTFKRGQWQESAIQIEKRGDASLRFVCAHTASLTGIFAVLGDATLPAMCWQPSTRTGSPRTKQNAAVAQVSAIAPARIVVCASVARSPSSATGPRVNANSSPR